MNRNRGFHNAQTRWPWTAPQKLSSCGVQSLHHALLLLGKSSNLGDLLAAFPFLNNVAFGHDVSPLVGAAKRFGAQPEDLTSSSLCSLRISVNRALKGGSPVILGGLFDSKKGIFLHWLVLAGFNGEGGYVWIDSADEPFSGTWDWDGVEEWIGRDAAGFEAIEEFEAIAIHPGKNDDLRRSMVPHIQGIYELLGSDEELAGEWGLYLDDLDRVFNLEPRSGPKLQAEAFFENNEEAIVQSVLWVVAEDGPDEEIVRDIYLNYRTVANFHSLELPACFEAHAIAHMAMTLRDSFL